MSFGERISTDALMIPAEIFAFAEPTISARASDSMPTPVESADTITAEEAVQAIDKGAETESASEETEPFMREEAPSGSAVPMEGTLQEFLDRAAALRIRKAIDFAKGNRNAAATALGIDRATLYRLMRRLGL
jgi:DNA-binding NtrC family response regulator